MIYIAQVIITIFVIWSAIQQGRKHEINRKKTTKERKAWHRNNFLLYCAVCIGCIFIAGYHENWWKIIIASLVIRVALFDKFYANAAGLGATYIGDGVEFLEGIEVKIFGTYGGKKKTLVSILVLITLNILNYLFTLKS